MKGQLILVSVVEYFITRWMEVLSSGGQPLLIIHNVTVQGFVAFLRYRVMYNPCPVNPLCGFKSVLHSISLLTILGTSRSSKQKQIKG